MATETTETTGTETTTETATREAIEQQLKKEAKKAKKAKKEAKKAKKLAVVQAEVDRLVKEELSRIAKDSDKDTTEDYQLMSPTEIVKDTFGKFVAVASVGGGVLKSTGNLVKFWLDDLVITGTAVREPSINLEVTKILSKNQKLRNQMDNTEELTEEVEKAMSKISHLL